MPNRSESQGQRATTLSRSVRFVSHILHRIFRSMRWLWYNATCFAFFHPLPLNTVIHGRLRLLHRPCRLKMGPGGRLGDDVYLATSMTSVIEVGKNVAIHAGCILVATERITIGEGCAIAEYVSIRDQAHMIADGESVRSQGMKSNPIEIGKNVWIGRGVYIGAGAKVGDNCVIGANSVVHGEFPPNCLIVGAPAKIKKVLHGTDEAAQSSME